MIRISGYPIGNIYFNEQEITKAYAGQFQVFPDQQIENTFWLKVTKTDASIVYCCCRQTAKIEDSQGNITELRYEVIQTQSEEPGEEYYQLLQSIYKEENTSGVDYTDLWSMMDKTPDEVYDLIPEITQKILIKDETLSLYKYGLLIDNMEGVYFGAGKTTDYDRMEFFFRPVNYGGASWFGVMNAPSDTNDFRLFGASTYIYFDCGRGRIYKTRITNSYMLKVTLVSGGTCTQYYYNGTAHQNDIGTSNEFSSYTGSNKNIRLGADSFYFYGFNGYKDNVLLDSIIVPDSYIEQGIYNKLYNVVKNEYITLSITPTAIQTNSYPYVTQNRVYSHGNILDDFSLNATTRTSTQTKDDERCEFKYKLVYVTDSLNERSYNTSGRYVVSYTYYTQDPTIFFDQTTRRVQAYGNGTVSLYVDSVSVTNPYILPQNIYDTNYQVTAVAQESGKYESNIVSMSIDVAGYKTEDPEIYYDELDHVVSVNGVGTVSLYKDGSLVSNPYTFDVSEHNQTFTFTATAQETGKEVSNTVSLTVTPVFETTEDPTITYTPLNQTVTADGYGTVLLYKDGALVSNPYTFDSSEMGQAFTFTATAQESGKLISNTVKLAITPEYLVTADPTITYSRTYQTVTADGYGTVLLYKDGSMVSNPYTFDSTEIGQTFTFTATAQESGKLISNVVSETITPEESTNPVFVKISDASEVNSGACDILVVCDKFGVALDGRNVTVRANGISVTIQQDGTIENSSAIADAVLHYDPSTLALTNVNGWYLGGNSDGATWIALSDTQASVNYQIVMSNNEKKDNRPVVGNNKQTNRALLFNNQNTTETLNSTSYYFRWYTKTQAEWTSEAKTTYWPVYIYKLQ